MSLQYSKQQIADLEGRSLIIIGLSVMDLID